MRGGECKVQLKGEDDQVDETTPIPTAAAPPSPPNPPTPMPVTQPIVQPEKHGICIQKPSQYIRDIQCRKGSAQGLRNQPAFPRGMPVPEVRIGGVDDDRD